MLMSQIVNQLFDKLEEGGELEPIQPSIEEFSFLKSAGIERMSSLVSTDAPNELLWREVYDYLKLCDQEYASYLAFLRQKSEDLRLGADSRKVMRELESREDPVFKVTSLMLLGFLKEVCRRGTKGFVVSG